MNTFTSLFKKYLIIIGIFAINPHITHAHVKWFAQTDRLIPQYSVSDIRVVIGIVSAVLIVMLGIYLEKKVRVPDGLHAVIQKYSPYVLSLASIGFGIAFLIFSYKKFIFAPNLPALGTLGAVSLLIQTTIGIMMLFGIYERIGGFLVLVLFALGVSQYGGLEMLDTLEMVGFGLYAMIVGRPKWKITETTILKNMMHKIHSYGYPLLRVGTGLNLIVLGFTEKLLNPSLTANFLQNYHWNFMHTLGVTDYWFAFMAGIVEVLFGVFFLFGLVTRITTIILAVFLVTTLILLGPVELIGHLPHFSIALVLLVLGSGSKLLLIRNTQSR